MSIGLVVRKAPSLASANPTKGEAGAAFLGKVVRRPAMLTLKNATVSFQIGESFDSFKIPKLTFRFSPEPGRGSPMELVLADFSSEDEARFREYRSANTNRRCLVQQVLFT